MNVTKTMPPLAAREHATVKATISVTDHQHDQPVRFTEVREFTFAAWIGMTDADHERMLYGLSEKMFGPGVLTAISVQVDYYWQAET